MNLQKISVAAFVSALALSATAEPEARLLYRHDRTIDTYNLFARGFRMSSERSEWDEDLAVRFEIDGEEQIWPLIDIEDGSRLNTYESLVEPSTGEIENLFIGDRDNEMSASIGEGVFRAKTVAIRYASSPETDFTELQIGQSFQVLVHHFQATHWGLSTTDYLMLELKVSPEDGRYVITDIGFASQFWSQASFRENVAAAYITLLKLNMNYPNVNRSDSDHSLGLQ